MAKTITFIVMAIFLVSVFSIAFAVPMALAENDTSNCTQTSSGCCAAGVCNAVQVTCEEGKIRVVKGCDSDCMQIVACEDYASKVISGLREKLREHNGTLNVSGKNITIKELSDEKKEIIAEKINAKTGLNLTAEDIDNKTILRALLSNGRWAQVKVMPNKASAVALRRMKAKCAERNCTVELKEVGMGNKTRLAYEVQTEKESRFLWMFRNKMRVKAHVDAETGEIISVKKPWWAFMASEKNESVSEETEGAEELNETNETA